MIQVSVRNSSGSSSPVSLDRTPDTCPLCHRSIEPKDLGLSYERVEPRFTVERVFQCPREACQGLFIARYEYQGTLTTGKRGLFLWRSCVAVELQPVNHSAVIRAISVDFCAIYDQAHHAEQLGLQLVAGPGYRKALEFLIKDYACGHHPEEKDEIRRMNLGSCIETYVVDERIKAVSKRASWLGNDETHYVRQWTERDLEDLKKLISLSLHWIEIETLTAEMTAEMPDRTEEGKTKPAGTS